MYLSISFNERVWLYQKKLKSVPLCPNCNKELKFKNFTIGYRKYCSKKMCGGVYSQGS